MHDRIIDAYSVHSLKACNITQNEFVTYDIIVANFLKGICQFLTVRYNQNFSVSVLIWVDGKIGGE